MTDADIHALRPMPSSTARPRRVWPWVLGGAALFTLLAAGSVAALLLSLFDGLRDSAHVVINGEPWDWIGVNDWTGSNFSGFGLSGFVGFIVATLGVVLTGLLVMLIVVPCIVLAVLLPGLGIALAVAAVTGAAGLVVALVFSPLWLFVLLLWLIFRRRPQPAVA